MTLKTTPRDGQPPPGPSPFHAGATTSQGWLAIVRRRLQQSGLARLCNKSTVRMINRVIRVNAFPETSSGQRLSYTLNLGFLTAATVFWTGVGVGCQLWIRLGETFLNGFRMGPRNDVGYLEIKVSLGKVTWCSLWTGEAPRSPNFRETGLENAHIISGDSINAQAVLCCLFALLV